MSENDGFTPGDRVSALVPGSRLGVVHVRVGDRIVARISERDVVEIGVRTGTAWTEELARRVAEADETERARQVARRIVNARPRSRSEIIDKIVAKEFSRAAGERVADELARAGVVDDARLAASIIASVRRRGGAGRRLLEQKLRARGIDRDTAAVAIDAALEASDPYGEALALARARAGRMSAGLDAAARSRRLYGLLSRRGFSGEVCGRVVREVVGESGDQA